MNPWKWYRSRRGWVQGLLGLGVLPPALLLGYAGVRSLQYISSEKEAGVYVPATANVVVRARHLEDHLARMRGSVAWRVIEKKILRDPSLRRQLSALLQSAGAPTLDDLEDERKPYARNLPFAMQALGSDVVGALQVQSSIEKASFCAVARLRWLYFLGVPFVRLALPSEAVGGEACMVLRDGRKAYYVAVVGALVLVSDDKALLAEALRRKGDLGEGDRPVEARISFERSPALLGFRSSLRDSGLFSFLKWETVRAMRVWADLRDDGLFLDAEFEAAVPVHADPPPLANRAWAPYNATGWMTTNTGAADLISSLKALAAAPGSRDGARQTLQAAMQALDEGGLSSNFLPRLGDGMTLVTGVEEQDSRAYSTFVLILPSPDPKGAVEAMNALVRKIAGSWAESSLFEQFQVGEVMGYSWRWPHQPQINELLRPTYAAVGDRFILGNNQAFTEEVIRGAAQGAGLEETSNFRKLRGRLKELGFSAAPALSAGFLYPPLLRESLDGVLAQIAKQVVYATLVPATLRSQAEAELRRLGKPLTDPEIVRVYNEMLDRKVLEEEADLRKALHPMDALKWVAFESSTAPRGISTRAVVVFR